MNPPQYQVRAVHCDHLAGDTEIYAALQKAVSPLSRAWERLKAARRIAIKFNQDHTEGRLFEGQLRELVSEKVARAVLRILRENLSAELFAVDVSFYQHYNNAAPGSTSQLKRVFDEFDVPILDCNAEPVVVTPPPGGGLMFHNYFMPRGLVGADEVISVQKMKNHAFMGISLSLKNLFGLMPTEPQGRNRHYYHHLVRMPYMLVDLGRILDPALNVIDALVGQAGREWGSMDGVISDALLAGDHPIATDACGAYLMGHDPTSDWLTPPFHRDRNALRVAAESGWGTVNLDEIDFQSEVAAPLGKYYAQITDTVERVISWRRTTAEQALFYRDHRRQFLDRYAGEYILLQQGEVRWHDTIASLPGSRRNLAGDNPDEAMWLKFVDPLELEGENFDVYERTLEEIKELSHREHRGHGEEEKR